MRRLLLSLAALLTLVTAWLVPSPAGAGGWALASFDPLPALVAGAPVDVTFRVLQHGVHPVNPGDFPQLDLQVVVHADGTVTSFPAVPTGSDGRFAAAIDVPSATASLGLEVQWTGGLALQQEPIEVPVTPPSSPAGTTGTTWLPAALGVIGVAAAAVAVLELVRQRPSRRPSAALG